MCAVQGVSLMSFRHDQNAEEEPLCAVHVHAEDAVNYYCAVRAVGMTRNMGVALGTY